MAEIRINGETRTVAEGSTIASLLGELDLPAKRVAVEHNGEVVSRQSWHEVSLNDGDRVEVVHFVGGG
ncbi:MAG: sulfur carrier protein ThiS [Acidobacteriota bacterium]|nr:MAG: sulfur carrier protein ThiS [Acidobacteriota bacterium]